jgi:hypothetical protein
MNEAARTATPIALMLGLALLLVGSAVLIDRDPALLTLGQWISGLRGEGALDRVASAAEVVAGVLAIAITVVAIVVELAANRYTHRITQLFVRDTTNQLVLGFFVLTTIVCLWTSVTPLEQQEDAWVASMLAMAMVTLCLLVLLPYFMFLFRFLAPRNVIARIASQALDYARAGQRAEMLGAIEELEDMARGARQHRDRSIALASVDALADVLRGYLPMRDELPASWFQIDRELARDPDFVALAPSAARELEEQRRWLEAKILRQLLSLFDEGLGEERDLGNLIALDTRSLAVEHADDHPDLVDLAIRFFNSYLRVSIRAGDMRTAYYVFDQYRGVAEEMLRRGDSARVHRVVGHLHEYGDFAYNLGFEFLLEVVAWDVATLIEQAAASQPDEVDRLLDRFLSIDRTEHMLGGVRRTQIQLATMHGEDPARLASIREALEAEEHEQYWEFTDRGINFSYLSPQRRAELPRFFALLGGRPAAATE